MDLIYKDNSLWREQAIVFLPDGTFAISQNIGARPSENGPRGAMMDITCEEPSARWRLRYHGPTRRTTAAELASGTPLGAAPAQLLDIDLQFQGENDIWDFGGATKGEKWTSSHYEQSGRISGRISCDGQTVEINGVGQRDHSRGARSYAGIKRAVWMQGHFPGGRSFALIEMAWTGMEDKAMTRVFHDGRIYDAVHSPLPKIISFAGVPTSFNFTIQSELGLMEVAAKIPMGLPQTFDPHHEVLYGTAPYTGVTAMETVVGPVAFTWNGLKGAGHVDLCWEPR